MNFYSIYKTCGYIRPVHTDPESAHFDEANCLHSEGSGDCNETDCPLIKSYKIDLKKAELKSRIGFQEMMARQEHIAEGLRIYASNEAVKLRAELIKLERGV